MVELHLMRSLSELGPAGLADLILLEEGLPSSASLFPNVLFVCSTICTVISGLQRQEGKKTTGGGIS